MRNLITRRTMLTFGASFAATPLLPRASIALPRQNFDGDPSIRHRQMVLGECYQRFIAADAADIETADDLLHWQTRYDDLVGAADLLRFVITDDTAGGVSAIAYARMHMMPSCERAILYGRPTITCSVFGQVVSRYFAARDAFILCIASRQTSDDASALASIGTQALRDVQKAMPVTQGDRIALRRVIESINDNDMVDVAMVRSTMESHEVRDFRSWAEPCGSFTCALCDAWLGKQGESS